MREHTDDSNDELDLDDDRDGKRPEESEDLEPEGNDQDLVATGGSDQSESFNSEHSISMFIDGLKNGDQEAAQHIWNRFVKDLLRVAKRRLGSSNKKVCDEEDVVQMAFLNFFQNCQDGRFPDLKDRHDLFQILMMLVDRRAKDQIRKLNAKKRGNGMVRGDSINLDPSNQRFIENVPEDVLDIGGTELAENMQQWLDLLDNDKQRQIALLKVELNTNKEIAAKLNTSLRSVERGLELIRKRWEKEATSE